MTVSLIPAAALLVISIAGILGLRRFPERIRIGFDAVCFLAVSSYFLSQRSFPVFPPLDAAADSAALGLRAAGGAWWLLGSRLLVTALWWVLRRDRRSREARLFFDLSAAGIYIATAAVVLNSVFALPVAGIVATSGVVAVVIGLALQNTLADVFAGIAVGIEAPFRVGDRIQIADRVEGVVVQINWRSIRIQTDSDDIAIIPNSLIAKAEIVNRSFPSQRRAAAIDLTCPNDSAPERVIEALLQATLLCPAVLRTPSPGATVTRIGAKRSTYSVSFFVESTKHLGSTKDMLLRSARRQLHYAGLFDAVGPKRSPDDEGGRDFELANRLLHDAVLFECLTDTQVRGLAAQLQSIHLEPGETLFAQGAEDASLYVVATGILQLTCRSGTVMETLGCIGAGEYVGEIGLLTGAPHGATATASTHCDIRRLSREAIAPLLRENAHLAAAFEKSVRHGLELLNRHVAASVTPHVGTQGQLLRRIRKLFHFSTP